MKQNVAIHRLGPTCPHHHLITFSSFVMIHRNAASPPGGTRLFDFSVHIDEFRPPPTCWFSSVEQSQSEIVSAHWNPIKSTHGARAFVRLSGKNSSICYSSKRLRPIWRRIVALKCLRWVSVEIWRKCIFTAIFMDRWKWCGETRPFSRFDPGKNGPVGVNRRIKRC